MRGGGGGADGGVVGVVGGRKVGDGGEEGTELVGAEIVEDGVREALLRVEGLAGEVAGGAG